ncbi:NAD(P)-binding protein [Daldinia vernicosa]|uniref:NAD(P)-binding protein n=1 Tax=Daldinia vernicosa TaxID=114800 RepID=UPI002007AF75|nr:NAD(P)-binding protein [Daldinia vernicosa]KAI0849861.1 NAD(P)-binding protein [Daldinia vernicosa]
MAKLTWLITGGSSGFGELFVRQLTAQGDQVVATGRNAESRLAHLVETGAAILDLDVTAPQAEIEKKFKQAWEVYGVIDVLVNNAGYIQCGAMEEITQEELQRSIDTMVHGPINLTRAALPYFRERGSGWLLYMNSQSGFVGEPGATAYCASKFAIEGAVESLAKELAWLAPGIKPLIIESGIHGTEVMANLQHVTPRVPFWQPLNEAARIRARGNYENPAGDAADMISKVIQIVKGIGVAAGKTIPLRIPFGSDCLAEMRKKIEDLQKTYEEWESVANSTDIEEGKRPMPRLPGLEAV